MAQWYVLFVLLCFYVIMFSCLLFIPKLKDKFRVPIHICQPCFFGILAYLTRIPSNQQHSLDTPEPYVARCCERGAVLWIENTANPASQLLHRLRALNSLQSYLPMVIKCVVVFWWVIYGLIQLQFNNTSTNKYKTKLWKINHKWNKNFTFSVFKENRNAKFNAKLILIWKWSNKQGE